MEKYNAWRDLPNDLLEEIMKRLPLKDYLRLVTICFSWREIVSNAIANKHCCHLPEIPLVFLHSNSSRFFFSLCTKRVHHSKTPLLERTHAYHGSVNGWLIMSHPIENNYVTFFFFNPVTDDKIMIESKLHLPINSHVPSDRINCVQKVVASSNPSFYDSDCYLACLLGDFCHIAIYKFFDKSWTIIESDKDSMTYFEDVETIGTKLYVTAKPTLFVAGMCYTTIDFPTSILVYDIKDSIYGPPKAIVLAKLPKMISSIIEDHHTDISDPICLLAKDEALGELYSIHIYLSVDYNTPHVGNDHLNFVTTFVMPPQVFTIQVFKLEMNKESIGWQRVMLDDKVAFVSNCKSMVMSNDALNYNKEIIKGNNIFFSVMYSCSLNPWLGLQLGMFCLTDSSTNYFPVMTSNHCDVSCPLWFVPSVW